MKGGIALKATHHSMLVEIRSLSITKNEGLATFILCVYITFEPLALVSNLRTSLDKELIIRYAIVSLPSRIAQLILKLRPVS